MAIRVLDQKGKPIFDCDSPKEAVALRKELLAQVKAARGTESHGAVNSQFGRFWVALSGNGRKLLRALAAAPEGVRSPELAEIMNVPILGLGRVFQYVNGVAKERGLVEGKDRLIPRKQVQHGGKQVSLFILTPEIREEVLAQEDDKGDA